MGLLCACSSRAPTGVRNRAIIALAWRSGLRIGEAALVARWLEVRRKRGLGCMGLVFCVLQGGPVDPSYIRHLLPRLARRAGIMKRVHAHGLRHAFAIGLEREGATVSVIRDLLGHSSAAVTDRYLRRRGGAEGVEFMKRREWPGP